MDVTWLLDHWKELTSGTLIGSLALSTLFKGKGADLWAKVTKRLPVKAPETGPTLDEAFAAIEVLASYAKATSNHSLSRSVINAFEDVANVPEVAE